ncbi:MAG: CCA tRNA nucleotidyltransferase [Candidatus Izemoplasmatales bacterium]
MNRSHILGKKILKKLIESGYEAYFVGGFVRDMLIDRVSSDIDITTNALPEEVERLFEKTIPTGKKYGTITVIIEDLSFEVTTYRIDQEYINYRKPKNVIYSNNLKEDLKRRDFTINALAMDIHDQVIDLFSGKEDLKNKVIRAIGDPDERFNEDALRIIRALRFVSKFNFSIENETLTSMKNNILKIKHLPNERVTQELEELFLNPYQKSATLYMETIEFSSVFSEFDKSLKIYNKSEIKLNFLEFMALSIYLDDSDIPEYWRFSNKDKLYVYKLSHLLKATTNSRFNASLLYKLGLDLSLSANKIKQVIKKEDNQEELIKSIYNNLPITKREQLQINGNDILNAKKINNEEIIGEIIEELEFQVINKLIDNEKETLLQYAKNLMERLDG